jgi:hypothetical protein
MPIYTSRSSILYSFVRWEPSTDAPGAHRPSLSLSWVVQGPLGSGLGGIRRVRRLACPTARSAVSAISNLARQTVTRFFYPQ